ncbi:MAG: hypothetical protein APR63_07815 [Desulfuromonas sp. SDB]|nr:MAG: hypothetical protein APR63_07815 [Desulfuromonas sp. SDB]
MPLIRSVSGIRGIIGEDFNPEVILSYLGAFSQIIPPGNVLVGRDPRSTGDSLSKIVGGTLQALGRDVIDLGIVTTPTVLINVKQLCASGAIIITASHNPQPWNALKMVGPQGLFLNSDEINKLFQKADENNSSWKSWSDYGNYQKSSQGAANHLALLLKSRWFTPCSSLKVIIDTAGGASATILPQLCEQLKCKLVEVIGEKPDSNFTRELEPICKNLGSLKHKIKNNPGTIGLATDTDGDRLALIDEQGNCIGEERTLQLAVKAVLQKNKGAVVANVSTSAGTAIIARQAGCEFFTSPVGEAKVVEEMIKRQAIIGGEGNGGVIFPEIHPVRDAQTAALLILGFLQQNNITLSQAVKDLPKLFMEKDKIPISANYDDLSKISSIFSDPEIVEVDGLKIIQGKEWVHVRKSGTEPVIRIISEAEQPQRAKQLVDKVKNIIRGS